MRVFRRSQSVGIQNSTGRDSSVETDPETSDDGHSHRDIGSILVAVEVRDQNWDALDWAACEAEARGCPLQIVHAFRWDPGLMNSACAMPMDGCDAAAMESATRVLQEARCRAAAVLPTTHLSAYVEEGSITTAILRHQDRDSLVVLATSRKSGFRFSLTSVSRRIRRHGNCPVALVKLAPPVRPGRNMGRVLVLLEGSRDPLPALLFAFRAAQQRDMGVTVLRAWVPRRNSSNVQAGTEALQVCNDLFPDVELRQRFVGSPVSLSAEIRSAALLVIGTGSRRRFPIASAGRNALRSASGPVVVIGDAQARANAQRKRTSRRRHSTVRCRHDT
jgi:nucleotide-binding universal stress UspA family protein